MMAIAIETEPEPEPELSVGTPRLLFEGRFLPGPPQALRNYDVSPASDTFMNTWIGIPQRNKCGEVFKGCARSVPAANSLQLTPANSNQFRRPILIAFKAPQDLANASISQCCGCRSVSGKGVIRPSGKGWLPSESKFNMFARRDPFHLEFQYSL